MIADVTSAIFVLNTHFVPALATVHDAMQQGFAFTRHTTCLVASVFTVVVTKHGLDFLEGFPRDVGGELVMHAVSPLLGWKIALLHFLGIF